jgi:hypothetical protein
MAEPGPAEPGPAEPDGAAALLLENPGAAIYGAITVGALLAAEAPRRETYPRTLGAVLIALVLYWIAHAYAERVEVRLQRGERLSLPALLDTMRHELHLLAGAFAPLLALVICWAVSAPLTSAVTAGLWTAAAFIAAVELAAGLRAGLSGLALAGQTVAGALLGALVIALRVLLH